MEANCKSTAKNWEKVPGKTNLIGVVFPSTTFLRNFFNPSAMKHIIRNTLFILASPRHQKYLGGDLPCGTALAAGQLNAKIRFYGQRTIYCCPKISFFPSFYPLGFDIIYCLCQSCTAPVKKKKTNIKGGKAMLNIKCELKNVGKQQKLQIFVLFATIA